MLRLFYMCLLAVGLSGSVLAAGTDDTQTVQDAAMAPTRSVSKSEAQPAAHPAAMPEKKVSQTSQLVCRDLPPPTGTRLGRRHVCMTEAQWQNVADRSKKSGQELQDHSLVLNVGGD